MWRSLRFRNYISFRHLGPRAKGLRLPICVFVGADVGTTVAASCCKDWSLGCAVAISSSFRRQTLLVIARSAPVSESSKLASYGTWWSSVRRESRFHIRAPWSHRSVYTTACSICVSYLMCFVEFVLFAHTSTIIEYCDNQGLFMETFKEDPLKNHIW